MNASSDKTPTKYFEFLVTRLQDIQFAILQAHKRKEILHHNLLNVVTKIEVCNVAYSRLAKIILGLINDLHPSLSASPATTPHADVVNARSTRRKDKIQYKEPL